ncbi:MAG: molecular chaperone HtpG, partial [Deltaproteobacteria bacterium]|nr:molecular chaperone HtpG [Deltaproteobacteria bacterium]
VVKRVLELNMDHPVMIKFKALYEANRNNSSLKHYSQLLYDIATIGEGSKLDNPSHFSKTVGELMLASLDSMGN